MNGYEARLFSDGMASNITGVTVLVVADSQCLACNGAEIGDGVAASRHCLEFVAYEIAYP